MVTKPKKKFLKMGKKTKTKGVQMSKKSTKNKISYKELCRGVTSASFKGKVSKKTLDGKCPFCGKQFTFSVDMHKDTNIHEIKCPKCKRIFQGTSTVNRMWVCDHCGQGYSTKKEAEKCEETCSEGIDFLGNEFSNIFEKNRFCFNHKDSKTNEEGCYEEGLLDKIDQGDKELKGYLGIFGTKKEKIKQEIIDSSNSFEKWLRMKVRELLYLFRNFMQKYGDDSDWVEENKGQLFNLIETKFYEWSSLLTK